MIQLVNGLAHILLSEILRGSEKSALEMHYQCMNTENPNTEGEMLSSHTALLDTEVRNETNPLQSLSGRRTNAPLLRAESIANFSQRKL